MTARRAAGLSALAALLVCLPALRGGFVIDDAYLVVNNSSIRSLGEVPGFFVKPWGGGVGPAGHVTVNAAYYRPLTSSLYAVEYAVFGPWAAGWHLVSILMDAAAAALTALLAMRTLGKAGAALLAGLIFAVHPVHTEAIAAICYQTTLLAGLLGLAALWALGHMFDGGENDRRWVALAACSSGLAGLAKEEAVVVPLLAAAWVLLTPLVDRRRLLLRSVGPMLLASVLVLAARSAIVTGSGLTYFAGASRGVVAMTMLRVVGLYAELLVAPIRLCSFYDWFIITPLAGLSADVVRGALLAGGLAAAPWLLRRRAPGAAVGLAFIGLGILPVMHLVPMLNVAAERFLYLPSVGLALVVGAGFVWARGRMPVPALVVAALLLVLFGVRTLVRWPDWSDDRSLNLATAAAFPQTPTPLVNLAELELAAGDRDGALRYLEEASRRVPGWPVPGQMADKIRAGKR
jgi:hypothetical protein